LGSVAGLQFGLGFAKTIFWGYGFSQNRDQFVFLHFVRAQKGAWGMNPRGLLNFLATFKNEEKLIRCK